MQRYPSTTNSIYAKYRENTFDIMIKATCNFANANFFVKPLKMKVKMQLIS